MSFKIFASDFYSFLVNKHFFLMFLLLSICFACSFILNFEVKYLFLSLFFLIITISLNYKNFYLILIIFAVVGLIFIGYKLWYSHSDLSFLNHQEISAKVIAKSKTYVILKHKNIKFYLSDFDNKLFLDQKLIIKGVFEKLESNTNYYQFDFFNYLTKQFVNHKLDKYQIISLTNGLRSNKWLADHIYAHKLISLFLLEKNNKSTDFQRIISELNLEFLIIISSFNIHLFTKFLYKINYKYKSTIILKYGFYLLVLLITYLANFSYASLRIIVYFLVSEYFKIKHKNTPLIFKRFVCLIICFVITPSFLVSSSALFVIVAFLFFYDQIFKNKFLNYLTRSTLFTFYFLPLQIYTFYGFSIVIQICLIFLRPLFAVIYFTIPFWLITNSNWLTDSLFKLLSLIKKINFHINTGQFNVVFLILVYLVILIAMMYQFKSFKTWSLLFFTLLVCYLINWLLKPAVFLAMLNVGNGNTFIFHDKYKNITIINDCGTGRGFSNQIPYQFLKYYAINKIDLVVISHYHTDHFNGLETIQKNLYVKQVIDYHNFEPIKSIKGVNLYFFWNDLKSENNKSLVHILEYRNTRILFTGDIEKEAELALVNNSYFKYVINLKPIDILQVPHHGSKSSSSDEFISLIKPKYGLISANQKTYNFPSSETLMMLFKHNITYFKTQELGNCFFNYQTNLFWFRK
ncbi:ComEC/Rec2 family competence protein [Mycoplasma putrefaciens]|uniref:Metallo-beta-lactamase superfamily protein n=1 Tax=Mycoplasma putrefaciens (strain ATCC 15718 / NCTC 10155 / C30 KS-1 / KS-1) TaxID=743965 RepID=A0A7U3ZSN6_MYCPK|nr:MBL fold metallo-hydrolase [Mycoplasma putrefaciens]AEM68807.1 metallo-beta-lactamase superfamily protein [Mycoplasma putrefaciens KS1]